MKTFVFLASVLLVTFVESKRHLDYNARQESAVNYKLGFEDDEESRQDNYVLGRYRSVGVSETPEVAIARQMHLEAVARARATLPTVREDVRDEERRQVQHQHQYKHINEQYEEEAQRIHHQQIQHHHHIEQQLDEDIDFAKLQAEEEKKYLKPRQKFHLVEYELEDAQREQLQDEQYQNHQQQHQQHVDRHLQQQEQYQNHHQYLEQQRQRQQPQQPQHRQQVQHLEHHVQRQQPKQVQHVQHLEHHVQRQQPKQVQHVQHLEHHVQRQAPQQIQRSEHERRAQHHTREPESESETLEFTPTQFVAVPGDTEEIIEAKMQLQAAHNHAIASIAEEYISLARRS